MTSNADSTNPGVLTPVRGVVVAPIDVLTFTADVSRTAYAAFFDEAFGALFGAVEASNVMSIVTGPPGATYPSVIELDETEPVSAFVPVASLERAAEVVRDHFPNTSSVRVERWGGAKMASATFRGGYDDTGSAYRLLGTWAAAHGSVAESRVREIYVVGPEVGPDTMGWITELQWPFHDPLSA